ncbi:hypothetical protein ACQJBY_069037 [Aegilops geniculata]
MVAASPPSFHLALLLFAAHAAVGSAAGAVGVSGGGQLWCVAKNNAEDGALQSAIDWACSPNGGADCRAIQQGGACYEPPDLLAHASYAFNDYFLRSGGAASPAACDFSGAAALIGLNPSKHRLGSDPLLNDEASIDFKFTKHCFAFLKCWIHAMEL